MNEIDELSKIVAKFQEPLRLHEGDAKIILHRFAYLKQKLGSTGPIGISDVKLLLTSVYCYIRTPRYGRKIVGPAKFVHMCNDFEFDFTRKDLWRYQPLYFQYEFYPRTPIISVTSYFEAAWYDISRGLALPETEKDSVLSLLKEIQKLKGPKRAPGTVVGAAIYLLGRKKGIYLTQDRLAEYFGISEVTLRSAAQAFESCLKVVHS